MARNGVLEIEVPLGPQLTAEEAVAIYAQGEEAVVFALLELARRLKQAEGHCASVSSPATPSGMTPIHHKPAVRKRTKKPGRKPGHPGSRRAAPERIDERKTHRAACCPHCQGRTGGVTSVAITPDGRGAVSASHDNTLKVWGLESGVCVATYPAGAAVAAVTLHVTDRIVCGTADGQVHFLTLRNAVV